MAKKQIDMPVVAPSNPATVDLRNRTHRALTFNLPHETYCKDGTCSCSSEMRLIETYNARHQEHTSKVVERLICGSFTVLGREKVTLDHRVLNVPEVAGAVARGELVVQ